jgi:phospholipase C
MKPTSRGPASAQCVLLLLMMVLATLLGCRGLGDTASIVEKGRAKQELPPTQSGVKRVIVVIMQNRSFDHLFGTFPGVEGIRPSVNGFAQPDAQGESITPFLLAEVSTPDLPHGRPAYLNAVHDGAMDRFAFFNGRISMGHYDQSISELGTLWNSAAKYALADNYFAAILGNAPANPLYMVAAADNDQVLSVQPFFGPCNKPDSRATPYTFPNIADQLESHSIAWAWFHEALGTCGKYVPTQNPFQYFASTRASPNIQDFSQLTAQLEAGSLPPVVFIQPAPWHSMHPASGSVIPALRWLNRLITDVQNSSMWDDTALLVVWDEGGGWWDHMSPRLIDAQGMGVRVPLLAISPKAKRGYVSHVLMDHVSILKFIQWNWQLPSLNPRNDDVASGDLRDMFSFD